MKQETNLDLMFFEPKHGWTYFNLDKYKGDNYVLNSLPKEKVRASYIGPLASTMFKVLIDNFSTGPSSQSFIYFDAEGWFWGLGITAYGPSIMIEEENETGAEDVPDFSIYLLECNERQFAEDWLKCWEAYKDEWVRWTICEYGEDELDGIKASIFKTRLEELKTYEALLKTLLEKRYGDK